MSREEIYATKAQLHGATKLSASDVGHLPAPIHKRRSSGKQDQKNKLKKSVQAGTKEAADGEGLEDSAMSAEDSDADDSDGAGADADEESSDAEEPDVIAPSGRAADDKGHQTGPAMIYTGMHASAKRSKHCLQADNQQDSSDDEIYEGVDLISDLEMDGSDMDHLEERAIVESEDTNEPKRQTLSMAKEEPPTAEAPLTESSHNAWEGLGLDHTHLNEPSDFFHEQFSQMDQYSFLMDNDSDDSDSFNDFPSDFRIATDDPSDLPIAPPQRHVHFAEPPHSEPSGFSPYNDAPIKMFEDEMPGPALSSSLALDSNFETDSDSSSGYGSDYGETTDEDDIPASATARPQALIRRSPTPWSKPSSPGTSTTVSQSTSKRQGPRMGSWCIDPTKPLAFVDACGTRILVCPARCPKKPDRVFDHLVGSGSTTANTSPRLPSSRLGTVPTVPTESEFDQGDFASQGMVSPMFGPPNAMDTILSENNFAATSAACPEFRDDDMALYADMEYDDDDDDHEDGITMEDLFNISSEDDDSEIEPEDAGSIFPLDSNDVLTAGQSSRNLLDHLDSGVVTAFRQNQHRVEQDHQEMLQPRSPLKRKASPSLHEATRKRIMA